MANLDELYLDAKKNSPWLSIEDGESFEGQFMGVEKANGQFGETRHYAFIIDGQEKIFNKKSFRLLQHMMDAKVKEGDFIKVTRKGEGQKTDYIVEVLKKTK